MHRAILEFRTIALSTALLAAAALIGCEQKPPGQSKDGQDSQATAAGTSSANASGDKDAGQGAEAQASGAEGGNPGSAQTHGAAGGDGGRSGSGDGGGGTVQAQDPGGAVGGQIAQGLPAEGGEVRGEARPRDDAATRQVRSDLVGRWKQVDGGNHGDFAEGGYESNELTFNESGVLVVSRSFDAGGSVRLKRQVTWTLNAPDELALGKTPAANEPAKPGPMAAITRDTAIPTADGDTVTIRPPQTALPATFKVGVRGGKLEIAGKTYEKHRG